MSVFDPASYLDATISEPTVRRPPLPAQRDFIGTIKDVKARAWQGKADPSKSGIAWDVQIEIDLSAYPDVLSSVGQDKVLLTDGIMLDLTEGGLIDQAKGKNNKLRKYRDALDMNKPGDNFSGRVMIGRLIRVKIKNETYEGDILDKVESVARP